MGKADPDASREMLVACRDGSAIDTSARAIELLNRGVSPGSVFDGLHSGTGELLMRAPGIAALHATTFTNAVRYAFEHARDDGLRRLLLVQNAAFLPLYRGKPRDGVKLDELQPEPVAGSAADGLANIFGAVGKQTLEGSRRTLAWLEANPDPKPFADMARRLVFLKGRDNHDYKFSSAVLEDYGRIASPWRNRVLAASLFNLRGTKETDNELVGRTRAAMGA